MTNKTIAALKLAEESVEDIVKNATNYDRSIYVTKAVAEKALAAIREALAEQEPVGVVEGSGEWGIAGVLVAGVPIGTKLYAAPVSVEVAVLAEREALAECKPAPDGRVPKTVFTLDDINKAAEMGRQAGMIDALAEQGVPIVDDYNVIGRAAKTKFEQALQNLTDFHQHIEATEPKYYDCGGTIGVVHKSQCSAAMKRNGKPVELEPKCSDHPDASRVGHPMGPMYKMVHKKDGTYSLETIDNPVKHARDALAEQDKQEPVIDLSKIRHEDKCCYWDDEAFCNCGADYHEILKWYRKNNAAPISIEAAVLAEREACAKLCEEGTALTAFQSKDCYSYAYNRAWFIRARGEK